MPETHTGATLSQGTMSSIPNPNFVIKERYVPDRRGSYPKRQFGQAKPRLLDVAHLVKTENKFEVYPWAHYNSAADVVQCITCTNCFHLKKWKAKDMRIDHAFISKGFNCWKETQNLKKHEKSQTHLTAVEAMSLRTKDVTLMPNQARTKVLATIIIILY